MKISYLGAKVLGVSICMREFKEPIKAPGELSNCQARRFSVKPGSCESALMR